jgi:hypothetical protein
MSLKVVTSNINLSCSLAEQRFVLIFEKGQLVKITILMAIIMKNSVRYDAFQSGS